MAQAARREEVAGDGAVAALRPIVPAGMAFAERAIVGHRARALLPQEKAHLAAAVWAELAETIAAVDARVPGSDIGRLHLRGRLETVSPRLFRGLQAGLAMAAQTSGAYDPTRRRTPTSGAGAWAQIVLDPASRSVSGPAFIVFDLSDLLGALAVEAALGALAAHGEGAALVQVDGCVGVGAGRRGGWAVAGPAGRTDRLRAGALALSAVPGEGEHFALAQAPTAVEAAAQAFAAARAQRPMGHGPRLAAPQR